MPSLAMIGPSNGEPVVEIRSSAASTAAFVSSVTDGPNSDWMNGLPPSL